MPNTTIARADSARGEVVLTRRDRDGELELRVNGVFVMDTVETTTERAMATLALESLAASRELTAEDPLDILVGGLGLGFTVAQLAASPLVGQITVVEIEATVVEWHQRGLIPHTARRLSEATVRMVVGDVREVVGAQPAGAYDVIVLDVDNGPGFLVYDDNAPIYQREFLIKCRETLTYQGILVVWSAAHAPDLGRTMDAVFGSHTHHAMAVSLGSRHEAYHAYLAPRSFRAEPQWPAH